MVTEMEKEQSKQKNLKTLTRDDAKEPEAFLQSSTITVNHYQLLCCAQIVWFSDIRK